MVIYIVVYIASTYFGLWTPLILCRCWRNELGIFIASMACCRNLTGNLLLFLLTSCSLDGLLSCSLETEETIRKLSWVTRRLRVFQKQPLKGLVSEITSLHFMSFAITVSMKIFSQFSTLITMHQIYIYFMFHVLKLILGPSHGTSGIQKYRKVINYCYSII